MKLYVCIPTFNEADNIEAITGIVDSGLQKVVEKYSDISPVIFNMDSASSDGTPFLFKNTQTVFQKRSEVLSEKGKGRNLLEFIKYAKTDDVDYCITIDADISSATPDWIEEMLEPLVSGSAQFVTPIYERSRFEGSTTNHFAFPTVFAFSGLSVRQPIGGDFAFSKDFISKVCKFKVSEGTFFYGIDIFLTLIALSQNLKIKQVLLGKKIHSPSFRNLEFMFPQIAESAVNVLRQVNSLPNYAEVKDIKSNIIESNVFKHKDEAYSMLTRAYSNIIKMNRSDLEWLPDSAQSMVRDIKNSKEGITISSRIWVDILSSWYTNLLTDKSVDLKLMARSLLPFFVLRSVGFWFASENMLLSDVENEINNQAHNFSSQGVFKYIGK